MDQIRWKDEDDEPLDYEDEVAKIKDFLLARKQFLDEVWTGQEKLCTVTFCSEAEEERYVSVIAGRTLERLPGGEPGTMDGDMMFDGWYTEDGRFFDGEEPIHEDITVYGRYYRASEAN